MEIRAFAERVLCSADLADKLSPVEEPLTDNDPGTGCEIREPARTPNLVFAPRRTAPAMPKFGALKDPAKRAIAHHIMANHELQALEVMAWTLLRFPDTDPQFRRGMVTIMADEQRHTRMHAERAARLGLNFGDLPVNCYIWKKALSFENVLDYLAGLPLVFEGANLDHSLEFAEAFSAAGDPRSAALMRVIHQDEIEHVRFGLKWFRKWKPETLSEWEAWRKHLHWPLRPVKARGEVFQGEARRQAGMSQEFIDMLERQTPDTE
ncbi:MAG: ferritin-like domain-containing protein [Planctomycetaceae bacterium]|nr:ferritin-like domain-containing protein [Planctomycetaceae bacterium]